MCGAIHTAWAEKKDRGSNIKTRVTDGSRYTPGIETAEHLTNLIREGNRAMVILVAQRNDVTTLKLADNVDSDFTQAYRDAIARGVEQLAFKAKVTRRGIELDDRITVDMGS